MKPIIAASIVTAILSASAAQAECPRRIPKVLPDVPDGSMATEDAMRDAQVRTAAFVRNIEDYLVCWEPLLSDASHNRLVEKAQDAAEAYNTELLRFRQRDDIAARS